MTAAVWGARELGAGIIVLLLVGGLVYAALALLLRRAADRELRALVARREPA